MPLHPWVGIRAFTTYQQSSLIVALLFASPHNSLIDHSLASRVLLLVLILFALRIQIQCLASDDRVISTKYMSAIEVYVCHRHFLSLMVMMIDFCFILLQSLVFEIFYGHLTLYIRILRRQLLTKTRSFFSIVFVYFHVSESF